MFCLNKVVKSFTADKAMEMIQMYYYVTLSRDPTVMYYRQSPTCYREYSYNADIKTYQGVKTYKNFLDLREELISKEHLYGSTCFNCFMFIGDLINEVEAYILNKKTQLLLQNKDKENKENKDKEIKENKENKKEKEVEKMKENMTTSCVNADNTVDSTVDNEKERTHYEEKECGLISPHEVQTKVLNKIAKDNEIRKQIMKQLRENYNEKIATAIDDGSYTIVSEEDTFLEVKIVVKYSIKDSEIDNLTAKHLEALMNEINKSDLSKAKFKNVVGSDYFIEVIYTISKI